ncbi:adenylyl-sulfate kinase [Pseudanabaena yagii GIHE-NHR1]|uniref:Adenylyl-sulfate kinase n=1 Tax=Pseudanabaena yagii GIHE-NHR1 TaxID=2722753 RepID=A0ABX1LT19_9CYAN|nr:adenylyl-sulfate kinase [Pseudanabaena yagii GIHE-NHR1]
MCVEPHFGHFIVFHCLNSLSLIFTHSSLIYATPVLDGDIVRTYLSQELGFSKKDRDTNIRRIAFVTMLLRRHQVIVIVSAISPYQKTREEARKMLENFVEVYVKAPLDVCAKRDTKGLYAKAKSREIKQFTGIDHPYEEPINPEIICHTDLETTEESINKVISLLQQKQYLSDKVGCSAN